MPPDVSDCIQKITPKQRIWLSSSFVRGRDYKRGSAFAKKELQRGLGFPGRKGDTEEISLV